MTADDAQYVADVDARLRAVHHAGARSFGAVLSRAQGADPVLVAARLQGLGLTLDPDPPGGPATAWRPELHPLLCEWYFTPRTAAALARRLGPGRVVCLGAPVIAATRVGAIAVDRHRSRLRRRFGNALGAVLELDLDLATELPLAPVQSAIVDPPWYPPHMTRWLALAASVVAPGGRIAMVLPPRLQRPGVAGQRLAVEATAAELGPSVVEPRAVRYATPLYENLALRAAGLRVPTDWRTADLLTVQVQHAAALQVPPPIIPSRIHDTFAICDQIVTLAHDSAPGDPAIEPVEATREFRWDRVTTRDPRCVSIDLWTSRSRVAKVRGGETIATALRRLAIGVPLGIAVPHAEIRAPLTRLLGLGGRR